MTFDACTDIIRQAGGDLTDDEIIEIAEAIQRRRNRLQAEGNIDNLDRKVAEFAREEGERAKLAAALMRKHAALNAIARDKLETRVLQHVQSGLSYDQAVLATLRGTARGVLDGRVSVAATRLAFEGRYVGGMMAAIEKERPHISQMLGDEKMLDDAVREMFELRDGGTPGITNNPDAQFLAKTFATYAELSRTDLNRLGGQIGKLDGWAGPQTHDPYKISAIDAQQWIDEILPRLDIERTFGEMDMADIRAHLQETYKTIISGKDNTITARRRGEYVGPANLARSLGKHRSLHFRSADDWISYQRDYGFGNILTGMLTHQQRAARLAAQMQVLGPNPEIMINSLTDSLQARVRNDPNVAPERKSKLIRKLQPDAGAIRDTLTEVRGLTSAPVDVSAAKISSGIRAVQSMSKLGGAVLSAGPPDVVSSAANLRFNGRPLFQAYSDFLGEFLKGRGSGEAREIAFLIGEGFDGLVGHIVSRFHAEDGAPGRMSQALSTFFKWSGLSWETDVMRAANARALSSGLGMHAGKSWQRLPANLRHVLGLHGIIGGQWEAIRKAGFREVNGTRYITPDRIQELPDEALTHLVDGKATPSKISRARFDLEIALRRYFSDEINYSIIEPDEASRAFLLRGTRPGTAMGEAMRFIAQFKSFPIGFAQRVVGRSVLGGRGATAGERILNNSAHIGHLIAGMTVAGYLSMTAKDLARGYEPRQPENAEQWAKVISAAFAQGGGAGIYGDFLFGGSSRFGAGLLETLAGPTVGTASDVWELWAGLREGDLKAAQTFNVMMQNTPFMNMFYTRPALDYLILNSFHESLSPGYLRRQERNRKRDYGQERVIPATVQ